MEINSYWPKKCLTEEGLLERTFSKIQLDILKKKTPEKVSTPFKNAGDISLFYSALPHSIKGSKVRVAKLAEL